MVICPNRKSETILLQQSFYRRFKNRIKELEIALSYQQAMEKMIDYDLIFTTEDNDLNDIIHAIKINYFLDEKDYKRIGLAFDGIQSSVQLIEYFSKKLMFFGEIENKKEVIGILCEKIKSLFNVKGLKEQIMQREELGGTYYGNGIAIPHPNEMISDDTFIALAVLKNPILWNEDNYVKIVFLVCIEKNNAKALQLWYFLSDILTNDAIIKKIANAKNSDQIVEILEEIN